MIPNGERGISQDGRSHRSRWTRAKDVVGVATGGAFALVGFAQAAPASAEVTNPAAVVHTTDTLGTPDVLTITLDRNGQIQDRSVDSIYAPGQRRNIAQGASALIRGANGVLGLDQRLPRDVGTVDVSLIGNKDTNGSGSVSAEVDTNYTGESRQTMDDFGPDSRLTAEIDVNRLRGTVSGDARYTSYVSRKDTPTSAEASARSHPLSREQLWELAGDISTREVGVNGRVTVGPISWTENPAGTEVVGNGTLNVDVSGREYREPLEIDVTDKGKVVYDVHRTGSISQVKRAVGSLLSGMLTRPQAVSSQIS